MKPQNSKERSKLFWQFFFIFVALCILPVAIIFYAYYETPRQMDSSDNDKLERYNAFEHKQKLLSKQLADIDSNIGLLNNGSNVDPQIIGATISNSIAGLTSDSSSLVRTVAKGYSDYFALAKSFNTTRSDARKATSELQKTQDQIQKMNDQKANADAIANGIKQLGSH